MILSTVNFLPSFPLLSSSFLSVFRFLNSTFNLLFNDWISILIKEIFNFIHGLESIEIVNDFDKLWNIVRKKTVFTETELRNWLEEKKELQRRAKSNFIASEAADRDRNTSLIRRSARGDPQETYLGK